MGHFNRKVVVDEDDNRDRMVTDISAVNAKVLNDELNWFFTLLDTRIKLHFGHECKYGDIFEIPPPHLKKNGSHYNNFVNPRKHLPSIYKG